MGIEDIKKYMQMVIEEEDLDQLHEMANISPEDHGIDHIVLWVGKANKRHGLRIKVSNIKDRYDPDSTFVIRMPSLDYDPSQVARWIDTKTLNKIFEWIKLNQKLLSDYENGITWNTREFLNSISKV